MVQDMQMLITAFTNNGLLHLFCSLKLTLAGQEVEHEHVNYPGQARSLLGLASYSTTCSKGCGLLSVVKAYLRDIFSQNLLANQNRGNRCIIIPNFITVEQRY